MSGPCDYNNLNRLLKQKYDNFHTSLKSKINAQRIYLC